MFENPHIIYLIAKQKHEELLAECRMKQLVKAAKRNNKKKNSYPCRIILFIADILIKSGISLKKRWAKVDDYNDKGLISQENE